MPSHWPGHFAPCSAAIPDPGEMDGLALTSASLRSHPAGVRGKLASPTSGTGRRACEHRGEPARRDHRDLISGSLLDMGLEKLFWPG